MDRNCHMVLKMYRLKWRLYRKRYILIILIMQVVQNNCICFGIILVETIKLLHLRLVSSTVSQSTKTILKSFCKK